MKFQLKTLAVAAILAVAAGQASAAISLPTAATGSSLLFYAFDEVAKVTYVQDLGFNYTSFLPSSTAAGSNFSVNVASSAAWNDYLAAVSGNTSNTYWGVVSGLRSNAGNAGYGIQTTMRVGDSTAGQTSGNAQGAVSTPLTNWILGVNSQTNAANLGYTVSDAALTANMVNNFGSGHNAAGKLVFRTDNLIGESSTFQYINAKSQTLLNTTSGAYANSYGLSSFNFNGNTLNYAVAVAAVPEPSTYAMMVAGLMLVGGIAARRRNSAK